MRSPAVGSGGQRVKGRTKGDVPRTSAVLRSEVQKSAAGPAV
jgi:hypothetical protein